jgi:hypothetical protein
MKKQIPEGTWFAVPLRSRGYALGVVARTSGTGIMIGYFFGKVWDQPPTLEEVKDFNPATAVRILQFGHLGLIDGTWPIIGRDDSWRREEWPIPEYVRRDELSRKAWKVRYSDSDPSVIVSETRTDYDVAGLERDALCGSGSVEIQLTRLLS